MMHPTDVTEKQRNLINKIRNEIGVVFVGNTKSEASKFITENLPYINKITEKQEILILKMCSTLNIKFDGTTKSEATDFISKHMDDFKSKAYVTTYNKSKYCNTTGNKSKYYSTNYNTLCDDDASHYDREDYCGISPYDIYDEFDMPFPF